MAAVPPRQVAILSVSNHDEIRTVGGVQAEEATLAALRQLAIGCGVDPEHMRASDPHTLLLRLDALPREDFLQSVRCMALRSEDFTVPEAEPVKPVVRVGAMSERALRSLVNDAAYDLIALMDHMDCRAAFLAGEEIDIWQAMSATNVHLISHEQLKHLDTFTGLLTSDRFMYLLDYALETSAKLDDMAVLYLDIDDFKAYNRSFSIQEGDDLLLFVANQIKQAFPTDIVAHLSVDRFAVLTSSDDIGSKCAAIHAATRAFRKSYAPELKCGVYRLEEGIPSAAAALDCAKIACESIKGRYDVSYRYFNQDLKDRLFTRRYMARHAEQAVSEGWIRAFAQPVIDTASGKLCGFEALARWNDPERGLLSPALFIPTLEDAHLIHKLDLCIVESVCEHLAEQRSKGLPYVPASVNISRLDFDLCDAVAVISDMCDRWNLPHDLLAIEITESALQEGSDLKSEMSRFRSAGFEVWMDDFGCGYSSLNLLKDYEFDVLKVDMEFLRDMEGNERSKKILRSVLEMARNLGIRTLVEGVETPAQLYFLNKAGCDMMQGYLFGRPEPIDRFEASLSDEVIITKPE